MQELARVAVNQFVDSKLAKVALGDRGPSTAARGDERDLEADAATWRTLVVRRPT